MNEYKYIEIGMIRGLYIHSMYFTSDECNCNKCKIFVRRTRKSKHRETEKIRKLERID